jgi:YkoY family integral membrane protein
MLEQLAGYAGEGFSLNTLGVLLALVALETSLSADNAVALATLVQHMEDREHQRRALNWGLVTAFLLRVALLLTATWVIQFWQFALAGGLYLLWLGAKHFWSRFFASGIDSEFSDDLSHQPNSLWQVIPLIALTDLAFSLDSVTAAVALSNETWLVLAGCMIGVIALRFLAGLFVQWIEQFTYLQDAAYLTVLGVGMRLLFKALLPDYVPPEWAVLMFIAVMFAWGFSKRILPEAQAD